MVTGAVAASGALLIEGAARASQSDGLARGWAKSYSGGPVGGRANTPGEPGRDYTPTITPGGATLPFKIVDGAKVFHLTAEEVEHEFAPGPTLEAVEGDPVRVYVTNKLPAPTTIHWHGVYLPNGMDGVGGVTQRAIQPGETFKY